jgi:signal peptidase I
MSSVAIQRLIRLLSGIAAPGLGFAIRSRIRPALLFLLLPLVCLLVVCWTRLITLQIGFYILCLAILLPWLYATFAAARIRQPQTAFIAKNKSSIIVAVVIFLFWWSSLGALIFYKDMILGVDVYRISGSSMAPTLRSGEYTIVDTWIYQHVNPERKDIVLLKLNYSRTSYIKRIVAVPGDTISFNRNSFKLESPTNKIIKESLEYKLENGKVTMVIPENNYFVIGDNITNTQDSRHFGTVKKKEILGRFCYVLF